MKANKKCKYCGELFINIEGRVFSNRVRWCYKNPHLNRKAVGANISAAKNKEYGCFTNFVVCCNKCSKFFLVNERAKLFPKKQKYYCSRSCSNSRVQTAKANQARGKKVSAALKLKWLEPEYRKRTIENCKLRFTSKWEEEVRSWFIKSYPNECWTFGGGLKHCNELMSRDLYSNKLKINIECDGIWHFENIHGQLQRKQRKDRLLEEWTVLNGWRLIRIREKVYAQNKQHWLQALRHEVECGASNVVKFYDKLNS